eukprot:7945865-Pyramimonas_sp.AAC.1
MDVNGDQKTRMVAVRVRLHIYDNARCEFHCSLSKTNTCVVQVAVVKPLQWHWHSNVMLDAKPQIMDNCIATLQENLTGPNLGFHSGAARRPPS